MSAENIYNIEYKKPVCPLCGKILSDENSCNRCLYNTWYFIEKNTNQELNILLSKNINVVITEDVVRIVRESSMIEIDLVNMSKYSKLMNDSISSVQYIRNPKTQHIDLETGEASYSKEETVNKIHSDENTLPWYKKAWTSIKEVMYDLEDSANDSIFKKGNN